MEAALAEAQKMDLPVFLTPNQVAATGVLSLYGVRRGIAEGTVPFIKVGSHYKVNFTKLLKQMNEGC